QVRPFSCTGRPLICWCGLIRHIHPFPTIGMSDREALLAAIRAAPDDDLPRLVYADWLEETAGSLPPMERPSAGDRAAFIRLQVEAARGEQCSPTARAAATQAGVL